MHYLLAYSKAHSTVKLLLQGRVVSASGLETSVSSSTPASAIIYDAYTSIIKKGFVANWHVNSVVTTANNWKTPTPLHKVIRRVKDGIKEITQPHLINSCTKNMDGVDLMDRLLESHCPVSRDKKWYWALFINLLNFFTCRGMENPL